MRTVRICGARPLGARVKVWPLGAFAGLALAGLLVAQDARAQTADARTSVAPVVARRLVFVEGTAGFGTPLGWLGASLVLRPHDRIATHVGAGLGTLGVQLSAGARASFPMATRALVLGLAWSAGRHAGVNDGAYFMYSMAPRIYHWDRAQMLNVEVSLESVRARAQTISIRPFVGLGFVLNGNDGLCVTGGASGTAGFCEGFPWQARFVPYAGVAVPIGLL